MDIKFQFQNAELLNLLEKRVANNENQDKVEAIE